MAGQIQLIIGPMFSGKSSELLRRLRRYTHASQKCLLIKHKCDTRYTDEHMVCTHDHVKEKALLLERLDDIESKEDNITDGVNVIGIDEGQFFSSLLEFCESQANKGKIVIVAALDATFERKPFGVVCDIMPRAEKVDKLTAVCKMCGADAAFSKRIVESKDVEMVGGASEYWPTCRECYFR